MTLWTVCVSCLSTYLSFSRPLAYAEKAQCVKLACSLLRVQISVLAKVASNKTCRFNTLCLFCICEYVVAKNSNKYWDSWHRPFKVSFLLFTYVVTAEAYLHDPSLVKALSFYLFFINKIPEIKQVYWKDYYSKVPNTPFLTIVWNDNTVSLVVFLTKYVQIVFLIHIQFFNIS